MDGRPAIRYTMRMLKGLDGWLEDGSEEAGLALRLDAARIPRLRGRDHGRQRPVGRGTGIATGRRPQGRGEIRPGNHRDGARAGLDVLSLFAFSTENWKRPPGKSKP